MKFTIEKPIEINVKYIDVYCGGNVYPEDFNFNSNSWEEVIENYPSIIGNINGNLELYLRIDVETGRVINWPIDLFGDFRNIKVVDEGTYILKDNKLNDITKFNGYVPDTFSIEEFGYGDYFEFIIVKGYIKDWKFTQDDVNYLFDVEEEFEND